MKYLLYFLLLALALGCSDHSSLNDQDTDYVRTTLDLLKTRANFIPTEDSTHIKLSLDSVYRRHHTSAANYKAQTLAFVDDPKKAEAIFGVINDSIGKK
jgi:hypothetical protein